MLDFVYYIIRDSEGFHYGCAFDLNTANDYAAYLDKKYKWTSFNIERNEVRNDHMQLMLF
ncbi:hypothetical protein [Virgibacillus kimchii]